MCLPGGGGDLWPQRVRQVAGAEPAVWGRYQQRAKQSQPVPGAAGCLATVTHSAPSLHPPQGLRVISGPTALHKQLASGIPELLLFLSREHIKGSRDPKSSITLASRGLGYPPCSLEYPGSGKKQKKKDERLSLSPVTPQPLGKL